MTDILIILNIPVLRPLFTFTFFTFVPGMLITYILRLNQLEFSKKFVLSIGLSIALLYFVGLALNSFIPTYLKPLSLFNTLISINIVLIFLAFLAYRLNKEKFNITTFFNFKINLEGKLKFPLLLPLLLPFLMIFGTFLMNNANINTLLIGTLIFIPVYLVIIAYLNERVPSVVYPISILMISVTLLLMDGLSSYHLMGRDIHKEFYCFQLTLNSFHWDMNSFYDTFNVCLSVTILPTIYYVLSNINPEYIFKLFFALIGSISPLVLFIISKKYIGSKYAFYAALLFMFQAFFIGSLTTTKQVIAIFFFFLVIFVLFETEIKGITKKILFIILMLSIVFSHYAVAYITLAIVVPILLIPFLKELITNRKLKFENFDVILLIAIFVFIWYLLVAKVQLNAGSAVASTVLNTGSAPSSSFVAETKDSMVLAMLGIGLTSIPNKISAFVHDIVFAAISFGLLSIIWRFKYYVNKIGYEFLFGIGISVVFLFLMIVVPNLSIHYGAERLFIQVLAFLAIVFVIGIMNISKLIKKPKLDIALLLIILIALFSCNTYLQYHFLDVPHSPYYEHDGNLRNEYYIYDQELAAANWIVVSGQNNSTIMSDWIANSRFIQNSVNHQINLNISFFGDNTTSTNGYIYLGYVNVNKRIVYLSYDDFKNLEDYRFVFSNKNKIYDSGAEVYF
ncbi:MAG: DUF2206 domain-containing protein [Methanobacterium sp.]